MDNTLKDPQLPSGPVNVRTLRVKVDRDLCIGAATCIAIAEKSFNLDQDAKAAIFIFYNNCRHWTSFSGINDYLITILINSV
jgi:ferredoxin